MPISNVGFGHMTSFNLMAAAAIAAAAIAAATLSGGAASAAEFGAIAYSTSTGSNGFSYDYPSRGAAEGVALDACSAYAGDCRVLVYFYNACGALAVGRHLGYGFAWNVSRGAAKAVALANCRANDSGCQVVRWVCSK